MATPGQSGSARINLEKAAVLVVDSSGPGQEIIVQIITGFGVKAIHRADSAKNAVAMLQRHSIDLIIADAQMDDGDFDGYDFVHWLRRSGMGSSAFTPVILTAAHISTTDVARARDCGSNIVVIKPLSPANLLQRIIWVAREQRMFVETASYVGPDRRFRNEGPPAGMKGRRAGDAAAADQLRTKDEPGDTGRPQKAPT